jgi:hypothetical protein
MCVLLWHTYLSIKMRKANLWWEKSCTEWETNLISRLHCRAMCGEPECSIGMWNVNKYQLRINSAVVGWNSKLSSSIGKQQPVVCLLVCKLVSLYPGNWNGRKVKSAANTKKALYKQGERFKNLRKNTMLISNFRLVLNLLCILLGNSPASDCGLPMFRNPLSVPSSRAGCKAFEDGTDRGFRNVGKPQSNAGKYRKEYIQ